MKRSILLLLLLCFIMTTGCVRRRLMVRSTPAGATVHVDNQPIGVTPCAVDFIYYGTREVRLSMQGYETLTVNQPIPTPWYELPGIDFVSENLIPNKIEDIRTVSYNLVRQRMAPPQEIVGRGEQLRGQISPTNVAPIGTTMSAPYEPIPSQLPQQPFTQQPLTQQPSLQQQPGTAFSGQTLAPLQPIPTTPAPAGTPPGFRY